MYDDKGRTPLTNHLRKKGVFITPLNQIGNLQINSWIKDRLPEYLWIGLILNHYEDRNEGLEKCLRILTYIKNLNLDFYVPLFSKIINLQENLQVRIFKFIQYEVASDVLSPLTIIFSFSKYPVFTNVFGNYYDFEKQKDLLSILVTKMYDHQSNFSTDIRYCVVYFSIITDHLKMPLDMMKRIPEYMKFDHDAEEMHMLRPFIRSTEITPILDEKNKEYLDTFWDGISNMTDCKPIYIKFENNADEKDVNEYMQLVSDIFCYYSDLYRVAEPLNQKMLVLIGIATYSYKRFSEIIDYNLYNSISGRTIVRVLIEDYIMMKYLLLEEPEKPNIWEEFQSYGIGQLKLIVEKYRMHAEELKESHVEYKYLDFIVNDYMNEEFLNMDTNYFNKKSIREKAIAVNEKELFDIYYDYDSSFEHGLWGAIRECAMLKCDTPGHQFHLIPDCNREQNLKTVWHDAKVLLNRTINLLIDNYGLSDALGERFEKYRK